MSSKSKSEKSGKGNRTGNGRKVPTVQSKSIPIGILVSDLHLRLKPPVARSDESDWLQTQAGYLRQVEKLGLELSVPVICAGDMFHRWNSPPELINFALEHLPNGMFAVPGQHDLPYHSYEEVRRSAYWTLVRANKIINLEPGGFIWTGSCHDCGNEEAEILVVSAFPWGYPPYARPKSEEYDEGYFHLAVVHSYVWCSGNNYPGAPENQHVKMYDLAGYDMAVFGDNHKGFYDEKYGDCPVFNCGGFYRSRTDEYDYKPRVGILYSDGTVKTHYLDVSGDKLTINPSAIDDLLDLDVDDFLDTLKDLNEDSFNFKEACVRYIEKNATPKTIRKIIIAALESK